MTEFVSKLWSNPALKNASLVKKENQVLSFIRENHRQLESAFSRPEYFPGLSWDDAVRLLLSILTDFVLKESEPRIKRILDSINLPVVMQNFRSQGQLDGERLCEFILNNLRTKAMRDPFIIVMDAISGKFFERYVPCIIRRRKVIYNEMIRRDRLALEQSLIPGYLSLAALFRPLFYYKFARRSGQTISLSETAVNPRMLQGTLPELGAAIADDLGTVPEAIYRPGVESCLNCIEHPESTGSSRLISILFSRTADYDPNQKVDKGAESPDKSWFNIHRRTAKFYGYDPHFLDELYQIAGEEGW